VKRIRKGDEPAALSAWKVGKNWQANPPDWSEFPIAPREAVRQATSSEQGWICCYCCADIGAGDFHIEHFHPQGDYPAKRYEWRNLLASCEGVGVALPEGVLIESQKHCGHAKGDWFDAVLMADPQRAGIEGAFRFPLTGEVHPNKSLSAEQKAAVEETIRKLNLRAPSLVARRREVLAAATADADQMSDADWRQRYLELNNQGAFQEFWPALAYNYQRIWRGMLQP
jgi:uncharacterized protein (TIGR02646 family)